ncbi:MAG: ATP-binding cassette domain-containing protein [Opitutales bacterium]|nr:ATP-binding cassette domain-containing protein [Opitutales bacterium]
MSARGEICPAVHTGTKDRSAGVTLAVHDLSLRYGQGEWLFEGVNFSVNPGQLVALAGPSGSGKTSLMRCLAGALSPTSGCVRYHRPDGRAVAPSAMGPALGVVFQNLRLTGAATAIDNVCFARLGRQPFYRTLFGFSRRDREGAYAELCALGLCHMARAPISRLSGGERQRVAVARALFQEAKVILADEPVASLDRPNAERCLACLRQRCRKDGISVLVVLHDEDLIERFADDVVRLEPRAELSAAV